MDPIKTPVKAKFKGGVSWLEDADGNEVRLRRAALLLNRAGMVDDFPPNSGTLFRFGEEAALLIRTPDGEFRAFLGTCTHLGCNVEYRADLSLIWCACHDGRFDLTGKNILGPPPRPLQQLAVQVRENEVLVSLAT